jgi:hypothetical protein
LLAAVVALDPKATFLLVAGVPADFVRELILL